MASDIGSQAMVVALKTPHGEQKQVLESTLLLVSRYKL
jgi:hypothetical protein